MEELTKCIKKVLKKYGKKYSAKGVEKNLSAWHENKQSLIDLLRNHPCWNEEAMAVVTEIVETRVIDEIKTLEALSRVEFLHPAFSNNHVPPIYRMNEYAMFSGALYEAIIPFQKNISHETAESVKQYADIRCTGGEKCSKVINKVCESYGVTGHENYNKLFAKLSDSVNPHAIKRKVILSVHPCDFLEMSNKDNSWTSCHRLSTGGYQAGTVSYMNDGVSMILYSISEKETSNVFYEIPKVSRQVFCYKDGILLQSRLYPDNDDSKLFNEYGEIVKGIIAACYRNACEWSGGHSVGEYCLTHERGMQYPDYSNDYGKVYLHTGDEFSYEKMIIGAEAYCMYCGDPVTNVNTVLCNGNCQYERMYYCGVCGDDISEDEVINAESGDYLHICRHCHEQQRISNVANEADEAA